MKRIFAELIIPAGLMSALIIGAGFFSLPYLFYQAGFLIGVSYLILFGIVLSIIHLMYAEITEVTKGHHRFVGYAKMYLGKPGFYLSFLTTFIGIILGLLIYIVLSAKFIEVLYGGLPHHVYVLIFWAIATIPMLLGVSKLADLSFFITLLKIAAIITVFIYGFRGITGELTSINLSNAYLPYAAVLFSLYGRSAISSIKQYLEKNKFGLKNFKPAILIGTNLPIVLYILFAIGVIGISHGSVSEDSISGLKNLADNWLVMGIGALGVMSLWTAYIFLCREVKEIAVDDLKLGNIPSTLLVVFLPITLYFLGLDSILPLIGIVGAVFIAIESILIIIIWHNLKKRPTSINISLLFLIAVFIIGGLYELLTLIK